MYFWILNGNKLLTDNWIEEATAEMFTRSTNPLYRVVLEPGRLYLLLNCHKVGYIVLKETLQGKVDPPAFANPHGNPLASLSLRAFNLICTNCIGSFLLRIITSS
jgi:hypothetical protein